MSGKRTGWWHGGPPIRGKHLLPPAITGAELLVNVPGLDGTEVERVTDSTKVYLTNDRSAACIYAAIRGGWLYEVLPLGVLEQDPDFTVGPDDQLTSVRCDEAIIMRREHLSHAERFAVIRSIRETAAQT
jgi:hypothetical protein